MSSNSKGEMFRSLLWWAQGCHSRQARQDIRHQPKRRQGCLSFPHIHLTNHWPGIQAQPHCRDVHSTANKDGLHNRARNFYIGGYHHREPTSTGQLSDQSPMVGRGHSRGRENQTPRPVRGTCLVTTKQSRGIETTFGQFYHHSFGNRYKS